MESMCVGEYSEDDMELQSVIYAHGWSGHHFEQQLQKERYFFWKYKER